MPTGRPTTPSSIWPTSSPRWRPKLLDFLGLVAYAARPDHADESSSSAGPDEPSGDEISPCRDLAPEVVAALHPWLDAADPEVVEAAWHAVVRWTQVDPASLAETTNRLMAPAADRSLPAAARAGRVLALRELGVPTGQWLDDPDQVVRSCAALSSAAADDRATVELLAFLEALPASDEWLLDSRFLDGWPRSVFVAAIIDRVVDWDRMLPAAVRVGAVAYASGVVDDWGPLLARAFPPARRAARLTPAQAAYLKALCDNDRIWQRWTVGSPVARMFASRGLPSDRRRLRRLLRPWNERMLGRLGDLYWRVTTTPSRGV